MSRLAARHPTIFPRSGPFARGEAPHAPACDLPYPTGDAAGLIARATAARRRRDGPGVRSAKCGVLRAELAPEASAPADLWDPRDTARSRRSMQALDPINRRMGRDAVAFAAAGLRHDWQACANMRGRHFTTDCRQLMQVKAG